MKNFVNAQFQDIYETILYHLPKVLFSGIILTYGVTAALAVYFLPLPLWLSIPAAVMLQFGRFSVIFIDFLNPTGRRSIWPPIVAFSAFVLAVVELYFSLLEMDVAQFWSVFIFGSTIIGFGWILEITFINKGAEAYGLTFSSRKTPTPYPVRQPSVPSMNGPADTDIEVVDESEDDPFPLGLGL